MAEATPKYAWLDREIVPWSDAKIHIRKAVGTAFFNGESDKRVVVPPRAAQGDHRRMIKAADGVARALRAEGTQFVSLFPECRLNSTIGEHDIPIVMMRDERYGVAVADAFSRVSNGKRFGVCTVQGAINAAGLEYATGAITQAFEDSTPLLILSDGAPIGETEHSHYHPDRVFANITKWSAYVDQPKRLPDFMARAFTQLKTGRPGPVLLQVPLGLGEYEEERPYEPVPAWKPQADPDAVKAAVKTLLAAKKPLLYVGQGVFYADACEVLRQFAELMQLPVLTTLKGKSAFPEDHPLSLGIRGEPADYFLTHCDVLLAIGSSISPNRFSHAIPDARNKTIIQCTIDTADLNKSYRVQQALIGDAKLVLAQLIAEAGAQTGGLKAKGELVAEIAGLKQQKLAKYQPCLTSNEVPIQPYRVVQELINAIDRRNSTVSADAGSPRDQVTTVYDALVPHGFVGWGNVSTLGFSLAAVIGAKLAYPKRTCVNFTGDAGIGYMLGNMEALVRLGLGITTVYLNNGGFAGFGPGFWGAGHDPYAAEVSPANVTNTAKAVEALGLHSERVEKPSEIAPALRRAFDENSRGRPAFLEVISAQYPVWGNWLPGLTKGA